MLLTPRYDEPSFLRLDLPWVDPGQLMLQQRRRLASIASAFTDEQWAAPSRCEGWSVQDVVAHLVSTNQFWALSLRSALQGEPTRFLASFDPVTSPDQLVESVRSKPSAEVLGSFLETTDALAGAVTEVDAAGEAGWAVLGEAPPGHVPLRAVALHALWDSWIHERDIVLPLGLTPVEEPGEVTGCLGYAASLSPAFAVAAGGTRHGALAVEATDPDVRVVVEVGSSVLIRGGEAPTGALRLTGSAVELLEGLSFRGPLPCPVPDEHRWLLAGLAEVFDRAP